MIYKAIKDYLQGFPQIGEPFFIGFFPNVSTGCCITPTGGMSAIESFDKNLRSNRPTFSIRVRTPTTLEEQGYNKIMAIYEKLQSYSGVLGQYHIVDTTALQSEPVMIRDTQERTVYTQNYLVEYKFY